MEDHDLTDLLLAVRDESFVIARMEEAMRGDNYTGTTAAEARHIETFELPLAQARLDKAQDAFNDALDTLRYEYGATDRDELAEAYDALSEQLGEMKAENANEVALYGDSGPGSALTVAVLSIEVGLIGEVLAA